MNKVLKSILDYSEVWALLIPLIFMVGYKNRTRYLKPIRLFVWVVLPLNICIILIWRFQDQMPYKWLTSNNFIYNGISIMRLILFSWFFMALKQPFLHSIKRLIPWLFAIFVVINFSFLENFFGYQSISSRLLGTEAAIILFYCLQYFIFLIREDKITHIKLQPGFWVVAGLSIYVAASFFIYLFYDYLVANYTNFAVDIWDVHNVTFIIFCIFIAKQFQQENKQTK